MSYDTLMLLTKGLRSTYAFMGILVALASLRVCYSSVLWSDEDYHMAAAINILHGKTPYKDFWYDKPPLASLYYLLVGALPGALLRLWDAAYVLFCCFLGYKLAQSWWTEAEGRWAAFLIAFYTTFYLPSAVIPFAPDALLIAPHLAAIYFARQGKPLAAGLLCAVGFWINVKALFVLAACALWGWSALLTFAGAVALGAASLFAVNSFLGYWYQVWMWGLAYAPGSPVAHPFVLAFERIGHWLGFHLALALAWLNAALREERFKVFAWLALSLAAVCLGNHFAPRYFLQLLPPLTVVGARGIVLALQRQRRFALLAIVLLMLVPFVRFGPRYILMAKQVPWGDLALDLDSQQVAARINQLKNPGNSLFVWGYRPDIYVFTRLSPDSRVWDSQPLTGVAADRHLTAQQPARTPRTDRNWADVEFSRPTFIVDGLGPLNDKLQPQTFPEMRVLLSHYREVARTRFSVIYKRLN